MTFYFEIPTSNSDPISVALEPGTSAIFVGANGGGKTRLAAYIEQTAGESAHRVAAHRALSLNPGVTKTSENIARKGLKYGYSNNNAGLGNRLNSRWATKAATHLLNDFDLLLQVLFAEQTNTALKTHNNAHAGSSVSPESTKFQALTSIWQSLLPHRDIIVTGDDIQVKANGQADTYSASEMSDGERAIFYLIGQVLVAEPDSLLIVDEPELHVHRSIIGDLWDELEAARSDCAFIYITHDIEFAAARDAQKYSIQAYNSQLTWDIEIVPEDSGFSEELTTLILGSRKPVLFVEGTADSLDISLYRHCVPGRMIVPVGSCDQVIHSVSALRQNATLTRIGCAGCIDADGRDAAAIEQLRARGVFVLPVSEIENLLLLPDVSKQIALCNGYSEDEAATKVTELEQKIFEIAQGGTHIDEVVLRYCRRQIDTVLKRVDLSAAASVEDLASLYTDKTTSLDVTAISQVIRAEINTAIADKDLPALLSVFDNKGLIAHAAQILAEKNLLAFKQWLNRLLRNGEHPDLVAAIKQNLPDIP